MSGLSEKVAIVTGASKGIGGAVATALDGSTSGWRTDRVQLRLGFSAMGVL